MPEQVQQLLEILNRAGDLVFITFEVIDGSGGNLSVRDNDNQVVLQFRPATLIIGADGHAGGLLIRDQLGRAVFNFNASTARMELGVRDHLADVAVAGNLGISDSSNREVLRFDSSDRLLTIGGAPTGGKLEVKDSLDHGALQYPDDNGGLGIGDLQNPGRLSIYDTENRLALFYDGANGTFRVNIQGSGSLGSFHLVDNLEREIMKVHQGNSVAALTLGNEGKGAVLALRNRDGKRAFLFEDENSLFGPNPAAATIGTKDAPGRLEIRDLLDRVAIRQEGNDATCTIGTSGNPGQLAVQVNDGPETALLVNSTPKPLVEAVAAAPNQPPAAASTGTVRIGGRRVEGELRIEDGENGTALRFECASAATLRVGSKGREGRLILKDSQDTQTFAFESDKALLHIGSGGKERILVDGEAGDILFKNADVAERFPVMDILTSGPGTVMVLADDSRLCPCVNRYDRRVVGVVAGAGHRRPGITLDAGLSTSDHVPISVFGKVCCKAEAIAAPIAVGDLLTTSDVPGHACKATNPDKAFGAVIGKALSPLVARTGMIELLVALQ